MRNLGRLAAWTVGMVRIEPWAATSETACLLRHAAGKKRLAEIGVWEGGTTRQLREVMDPSAVLFAIDPFPRGRLGFSYQLPIAHGEARRASNGRVIWIRAAGSDAAADPRVSAQPFDFIFLDGDHSEEGLRADWGAWAPLAADIIALHDVVGVQDQGSARYAQQHVFSDPRFELVDTAGCLAVLRRRGAHS